MLTVSLLGPLEVRRDGALVAIPGGKTAEVLVRLALEPGVVVRTDRLVEDLWADAINTSRNTVQSKIARLRRALGDAPEVVSSDGGYMLEVDAADVDALAVLGETATASHLLTTGEQRRAADLSGSALSMFRGELLPGANGDWADVHRARLDEALVTLLETHFTARIQLGEAADVIGDLEAAVGAHPFQESLWELLVTALYRAGRQADALAAYQRVRAVLAEQLGLEPGPRLKELEQQILSHDESLRGTGARRVDAASNLPTLTAELIGRDAEIATLTDLLAEKRLVTIVGPGGIGKTAVAIETGRQLQKSELFAVGGIWLVRLEAATTAAEVVDGLIATLGVTGGESALFDRLKLHAAILVMDNCEHVVDSVADLVARLVDTALPLHILATSQVALGVEGETTLELAPLAIDDAIELFDRRAITHGRSRTHTADDEVEELCRSLDGLPLAIELAAARTRTLSIAEITRRLDDRFNILSDPTSRRPDRRRALRSTIGWSYDLLFPDDQRGLWALATFAGTASLPAVEHVLEALEVPATAAIDVLGRLAARSLLVVDVDPDDESIRYRLLDSIRAYAREAMAAAGMHDRALAAHAGWLTDLAASNTDGVRGRAQAEHLAVARAERANIDAALIWCTTNDPQRALAIALGFGWAWIVLGDSRGAQRLLSALDAAGTAAAPRDRASALLLTGWIEASIGRLELAYSHIEAATQLADEIGEVDLQARCSYYLAYVVSHEGQWRHALELTARAASLYDTIDRPWDQAANALFAARAANSAGDRVRAAQACDTVRMWSREVEDPWLRVRGEGVFGELARIEHRFDDAVAHITIAANTARELGFKQTEAYQLSSLGRAQCQAGDYDAGTASLQLSIAKAEAIGDVRMVALARVHLGRVLRAQGLVAEARAALEAAAAWHREAGSGEQAALGECLLTAIDAAEGAPVRAQLREILDDAQQRDDAPVAVFALDALARIAAVEGDESAARRLRADADRRMRGASHFITEADRVDTCT